VIERVPVGKEIDAWISMGAQRSAFDDANPPKECAGLGMSREDLSAQKAISEIALKDSF
jgi:hypothetical protein